jgi:hypothetical protein
MKKNAFPRSSRLLILRPHPWTWRPVPAPSAITDPALAPTVKPPSTRLAGPGEREHSVRVDPPAGGCWHDFLRRR